MKSATVAVDLAKSVSQLAVADASWKVIATHRLTRSQFERWFHAQGILLGQQPALGRIFNRGYRYLSEDAADARRTSGAQVSHHGQTGRPTA